MSYFPESPHLYNKDQIILTSGRLLFNAREDAILLFAKKAISLSSADSVHINCDVKPGFIVNAPQIHLGLPSSNYEATNYNSDKLEGQHAQEYRLVKGEILRDTLHSFLDNLKSMLDAMDGDYPFSIQALSLSDEIQQLKIDISNSLSKQNFTI